jgi:hypothetical protein
MGSVLNTVYLSRAREPPCLAYGNEMGVPRRRYKSGQPITSDRSYQLDRVHSCVQSTTGTVRQQSPAALELVVWYSVFVWRRIKSFVRWSSMISYGGRPPSLLSCICNEVHVSITLESVGLRDYGMLRELRDQLGVASSRL